MSNGSDSTDNMRAVRPQSFDLNSMIRDVLAGVNKTAQVVGEMRGEMTSIRDSLAEHRSSRDRDGDDRKDQFAAVDRKLESFELRIRALEVAQAAQAARFGYIVAALTAVAMLALGAMLKALHLG